MLSVVLPCAKSASYRHTLLSLERQTLVSDRFEVIVMVETESEEAGVRDSLSSLPVRVFRHPRASGFDGHSAGRLRNAGAERALGDLLLFLDADCILHPRALETYLEIQPGMRDAVICGECRELPVHAHDLLRDADPSVDELLAASLPDYRRLPSKADRWEWLYAGNVCLPKELFRRVGGFDERGHRIHDLDLGYRLHLAGAEFSFAPECAAVHIEHPRSAAHRLDQAAGWRHLGRKHPEIADYAEHRALYLQQLYQSLRDRCEATFLELTSGLPGVRLGDMWLAPLWFDRDRLTERLERSTYLRSRESSYDQFVLRLHRSCWDYSIRHPHREAGHPRVSVLMPAFNAGRTIAKAIRSVLSQSDQRFELIVVDDASRDATAATVNEFCVDGRIRLIQSSENLGLARSLNRALEAARGDIVLQLDADDWLEPGALSSMIGLFDSEPGCGAAYADTRTHSHGERRVAPCPPLHSPADCLTYPVTQAPRSYRRDLLRRIGGWSVQDSALGRYFEDRLTLARMCGIAEVRHLPRPLYNVEVRQDSLSRGAPGRAMMAKLDILWSEANRLRLDFQCGRRGGRFDFRLTPRPTSVPGGEWTIVIPAYGQAALLRYSLRSWLESDAFGPGRTSEIIVVDDHSPAPLEEELGPEFAQVRFIRHERREESGTARNSGARAATAPMLFFADADHIVPPDVLACHERRHRELDRPGIVVGGRHGRKTATHFEPARIDAATLERLFEQLRFDPARLKALAGAAAFGGPVDLLAGTEDGIWPAAHRLSFSDSYLGGWLRFSFPFSTGEPEESRFLRFRTGNASMPKSLFEDLGGFDAAIPRVDDWDFGLRSQAAGIPLVDTPESEPLHQLHPATADRDVHDRRGMKAFLSRHRSALGAILDSPPAAVPPGGAFIRAFAKGTATPASPAPAPPPAAGPPRLALTFDDGPHPVGTLRILEALAGAPATFFILGAGGRQHPEILRDIAQAGCELAVHGWQHEPVTEFGVADLADQMMRTVWAVEDACGVSPRYCRPCYGRPSSAFFRAAKRAGLQPVGWHLSIEDWRSESAASLIARLAIPGLRDKVVLMHDGVGDFSANCAALRWVLEAGRSSGLETLSLSAFRAHPDLHLPDLD